MFKTGKIDYKNKIEEIRKTKPEYADFILKYDNAVMKLLLEPNSITNWNVFYD